MAKANKRGRPFARASVAPRITAAAVSLVTDIDRAKTRIVKLARRLDVPVPNVAADTAASTSITGAITGGAAAVAALHDLLAHIEQSV